MTSQENIERVQLFFDALTRGELGAIDQFFAPWEIENAGRKRTVP